MVTFMNEGETYSREGIKDYLQEADNTALKKMYPDEQYKNKYLLFLEFQLYWPFVYSEMSGKIEGITGKVFHNPTGNIVFDNLYGSLEMPSCKIRRPYPNKSYHIIAMKNGRKLSDRGVPLIFDSLQELKEISKIYCCWGINYSDTTYRIGILHDISFVDPKTDKTKIYGFRNSIAPVFKYISDKSNAFTKQFSGFDKVVHLKKLEDGDEYEKVTLVGDDSEGDTLSWENDVFDITFNNININAFKAIPSQKIFIDCFHSYITLTPNLYFGGLP